VCGVLRKRSGVDDPVSLFFVGVHDVGDPRDLGGFGVRFARARRLHGPYAWLNLPEAHDPKQAH
jgi:hypothetical protein